MASGHAVLVDPEDTLPFFVRGFPLHDTRDDCFNRSTPQLARTTYAYPCMSSATGRGPSLSSVDKFLGFLSSEFSVLRAAISFSSYVTNNTLLRRRSQALILAPVGREASNSGYFRAPMTHHGGLVFLPMAFLRYSWSLTPCLGGLHSHPSKRHDTQLAPAQNDAPPYRSLP